MSLSECLRTTTARQYVAWMVWFSSQWKAPDEESPGTYALTRYLMQLNRDVKSILRRQGARKLEIDDFKIKFTTKVPPRLDAKTVTDWEMSRWKAALGMLGNRKPTIRKKPTPQKSEKPAQLPIPRVKK